VWGEPAHIESHIARLMRDAGKGSGGPSLLLPLQSGRLRFHKDVTGRWPIAGYIIG